jgi:hypothetical protein
MKTGAAVALAAVIVSGSMLAASRGPGAPDPSSPPAATQSASATIAFTNVNFVPMDSERVLTDQTVLVVQGRIRRLGSADEVRVPAGVTTVDGSGKYLMPGLAKMHGHMPGGDVEEMVMFLYVANGVTTVRGMLGLDGHMELRRKANAGEIVAPTLYLAGPSFNDNSVSSPQQAAQKVRTQKEQGWDLLKIHLGLTVPEYDAMAMTVHKVGIRFGGHVPAEVRLKHAIEMGQKTFDHLDGFIEVLNAFDEPIERGSLDALVAMVKDAGSWVVPTIGTLGRGHHRPRRRPGLGEPPRDALLAETEHPGCGRGGRGLDPPTRSQCAERAGGSRRSRPLGQQQAGGAQGPVGWGSGDSHGDGLTTDLFGAGVLAAPGNAGDGRGRHVTLRDPGFRHAGGGRVLPAKRHLRHRGGRSACRPHPP